MNDVYVGLFIVAAYTLFAPLWLGRWRRAWAFWLVLPVIGLLLGLALASKWIGLYAIAAMAVLILGRSALGRIVLILGLVAGTTVLGYMALAVPKEAVTSGGNFVFVALMIALTLAAVLVTVLRPIAWSTEEIRLGDRRAGRPGHRPLPVGGAAGSGIVRVRRGPGEGHPDRGLAGPDPGLGRGLADPPFRRGLGPRTLRRDARAGRPDPAHRAGRTAARGLAPTGGAVRPADRLGRHLLRRHPGRRLRAVVPAVDRARQPADQRLAAGTHRPDPARPDDVDVRLPQRPAGHPRRVVALLGLAVRPQAGLVLPGLVRQRHGRRRVRRREPRRLVDLDPGDGLRRLAGVQAAEPRPRPRLRGVRLPVDALGAGSTGPPSSTTTTPPCRSS